MKTKNEVIERTVYVYAEAKSQYEIDNLDPGEAPFTFRIKEFDYGDESCVRIHEEPISVMIPAGIDITLECVKNLEERIEVVRKEADKEIEDLRARIRQLALIEYKPVADEQSS